MQSQVWIVDFGSQYTQLITRRLRELGVKSEMMTVQKAKQSFAENLKPKALILSGGPQSVYEDKNNYDVFFKNTNEQGEVLFSILGICYGMQLMSSYHGGVIEKGITGEYGHSIIRQKKHSSFGDLPQEISVWMSHSDHVKELPTGFDVVYESQSHMVAAIENLTHKMMGLQFHPEVEHTEKGVDILRHFLFHLSGLQVDWSEQDMLEEAQTHFKNLDQEDYVLCAFSGGVDSLVAATIAHEFLGDRLICFFVDHGLLRPQDLVHIETLKKKTPLNIQTLHVKDIFFSQLSGVSEPETKRKIIGKTFIDVFEQKVHEYEQSHNISFKYLLQGTLYPDVIESLTPHEVGGISHTIKSHHNVGGLPETMNLKLLEPLRFLFKDEVRLIGEHLGLDYHWVHRHPFPGPGLGIRVLGEVSEESVQKVQDSDQILFEELQSWGLYDHTWQALTVLLPIKTVGVKGDQRAYEEVICLRMVNSKDAMTATWSEFSHEFLSRVSARITNEVRGVTRVVYDITSKPPGTIEWE